MSVPRFRHKPERKVGVYNRRPETVDRMVRAVEMAAGGMSQREIGAEMDLSQQEVGRLIREALAVDLDENDEVAFRRAVEGRRLDMLQQFAWKFAAQGDLRAADFCRKVIADRRQMYGLDVQPRFEQAQAGVSQTVIYIPANGRDDAAVIDVTPATPPQLPDGQAKIDA